MIRPYKYIILFFLIPICCSAQEDNRARAIEMNNTGTELAFNKFDSTSLLKSIYYFDEAIRSDSSLFIAYQNKVYSLKILGMNDEALSTVNTVLSYSDSIFWLTEKANLYEALNNREKAEEVYKIIYNKVSTLKKQDYFIYYILLTKYYYGREKAFIELERISNKFHYPQKEVNAVKEILESRSDSELPFQ